MVTYKLLLHSSYQIPLAKSSSNLVIYLLFKTFIGKKVFLLVTIS